jgi:hypothetical protein
MKTMMGFLFKGCLPLYMLKRIPAVSLLVIYLITSTGFALNLHYCGKTVSRISINKTTSCCAKSEKPMKCCHDQTVDIRLSGNYVQAEKVNAGKTFELTLFLEPGFRFNQPAAKTAPCDILFAHGPPLITAVPIFLKNRIFRI